MRMGVGVAVAAVALTLLRVGVVIACCVMAPVSLNVVAGAVVAHQWGLLLLLLLLSCPLLSFAKKKVLKSNVF